MDNFGLVKELVKPIIDDPFVDDRQWSLQGLGMLRTYIGDSFRLHIWIDDFRYPGVSTIHTHPWDFDSLVISGHVRNTRYLEAEYGEGFRRQKILCGEGGCLVSDPEGVVLVKCETENYYPGQKYTQETHEIHESDPANGTVTIIDRSVPSGSDPDHAYVYFRGDWVTTEPRPATEDEVMKAIEAASRMW